MTANGDTIGQGMFINKGRELRFLILLLANTDSKSTMQRICLDRLLCLLTPLIHNQSVFPVHVEQS